MMSGGSGLLTYLSPALAGDLYPYNAIPALVGETSLMLWLLLRGVNVQRREELASAARQSGEDPRTGWQNATQTAKPTASDGAAHDNLGSDGGEGSNGVAMQ